MKVQELLIEAKVKKPWDVLNRIAKKSHGEEGFATLDGDDAAKYVNIMKADKIADQEFGEFGLMTLSEPDMKSLLNKHPELLKGTAKKALSEGLIVEDRQKDLKYTEKRVKDAIDKVTVELSGDKSGAMTRLMTRYQRLDKAAKLHKEMRDKVNTQIKDVGDRLFDAEDAVATRIIETIQYTVMLTKAEKAENKEAKKDIDYASAYSELAKLVPELEAQIKAITEKYTTLIPPKDTPTALKVKSKVEEGVVQTMWKAIKDFAKSVATWGQSYDAKLDAFRRKYKLKSV